MLKSFLKAGFGGVGAQLINFVALPVISRLYTPQAYASWAIIMATATIMGSISCFRYELAIVIPKNDDDASSVFWWCIASSTGMGIVAAICVNLPVLKDILTTEAFRASGLHTLFVLLLVMAMGFTFSLQYWNVRKEAFFLNSLSQIALAASTFMTQVICAELCSGSSSGLLAGSFCGQCVAAIVLLAGIVFTRKYPRLTEHIVKKIPNSLNKQRRFFFFSTPYTLFGMVRNRASVFVLEYFLSQREVGLFAFAFRVLNFPVNLVSNALRPVLFQHAASEGILALEDRINKILKWIGVVNTPFVVLYCFYPRDLFGWFFGEKWADAGFMGIFMIFPVFTFLFCNWMDRIMDVMGKQKLTLLLEIVFASTSIVVLWFGFLFHFGLVGALFLQCTVLVIYNVVYLYVAYDKAGYNKNKLYELFCICLMWGAICCILLIMLKWLMSDVLTIALYFPVICAIVLWHVKYHHVTLRVDQKEIK